jgi:hypothetical protein
MTIEMENEMTKDEIQAALSSFNSAMAYNPKIMAHCEKETIRAALQSPRVPVIPGLDRAIKIYDEEKSLDFEGYCIFKAAKAYAELQKETK